MMGRGAAAKDPVAAFWADHPSYSRSLTTKTDSKTSNLLFMGRVADPAL